MTFNSFDALYMLGNSSVFPVAVFLNVIFVGFLARLIPIASHSFFLFILEKYLIPLCFASSFNSFEVCILVAYLYIDLVSFRSIPGVYAAPSTHCLRGPPDIHYVLR